MKWTLYPKTDLRTSLPLTVEIEDWDGTPSVTLSGVGPLELKPLGNKLKADFYLRLPGQYRIEVRDRSFRESQLLEVMEHRYLDFKNEFGVFLVLFLIVMGGIVQWTRKIMRR